MQLYSSPEDYLYNLETTSPQEARKLWKKSIKEKWEHKCGYCESTEDLTLDHIIPQAKGGGDHLTNVICCCLNCNRSKGHYDWIDWYRSHKSFTLERYDAIVKWRTQLSNQELRVYRPRKNMVG